MSPALLGITTTAKKLRGWLWLKAVNCWSAKCILSAERTPCVVRLNKPKIHSFSDRRTPPLKPFKHSPSHGWSLASKMPLVSVVASGPKPIRIWRFFQEIFSRKVSKDSEDFSSLTHNSHWCHCLNLNYCEVVRTEPHFQLRLNFWSFVLKVEHIETKHLMWKALHFAQWRTMLGTTLWRNCSPASTPHRAFSGHAGLKAFTWKFTSRSAS